jgi:hypothetical protein
LVEVSNLVHLGYATAKINDCVPWRPLLKKAVVTADIIWRLRFTHSGHPGMRDVAGGQCNNLYPGCGFIPL